MFSFLYRPLLYGKRREVFFFPFLFLGGDVSFHFTVLFVPTGSPSHGGDVAVCLSFLLCSCVYFCLYGPFNCISFNKYSRQLSAFSLCSSGLISASLVLSTTHLFVKVSFSPDVILCGWLGSKHQIMSPLSLILVRFPSSSSFGVFLYPGRPYCRIRDRTLVLILPIKSYCLELLQRYVQFRCARAHCRLHNLSIFQGWLDNKVMKQRIMDTRIHTTIIVKIVIWKPEEVHSSFTNYSFCC